MNSGLEPDRLLAMPQLEEKVAIITGAGSGIGKAIALAFGREGARLVLASRKQRRLEKTAEEIGSADCLVMPTDVTREDEVIRLFETTLEKFGRVDILVNNSGAFDGGPLDELPLETWQKVVDVNLTGPFLCSREAMKIMKRQGGGRIINVGSISAQVARADSAPYVTTKHGLVGLTRATALEGREFGVAASCLHPGNVLTERRDRSTTDVDQEPMMDTSEIAKAAVTMAALHPDVNMLEAIVLPVKQHYLGRG